MVTTMTEAENQGLAIYEMICATSGGRPLAFHSVEQLKQETSEWKERNPALTAGRSIASLHCFHSD